MPLGNDRFDRPVCSSPQACQSVVSQLVNICLPITVKPCATIGSIFTLCCGDPVIGTECPGIPRGSCAFTVSQVVCVAIPVNFGADATPGETHIQCDPHNPMPKTAP